MRGMSQVPAATTRAHEGRWLGGVCAGLAARWDVSPGRVRLGFVIGTLFFGLGALAYVAAWMILPGQSSDSQRGIVALAQYTGALLGLATLVFLGGIATIFGYGWLIVGLACIALVATLAGWARLGPAWALLPIGALTLPAVAMALGGVHLDPSYSPVRVTPRTYTELQKEYKSGLGLLTFDLRHTALPKSGTVRLNVDAGVRRTLIALPHDQCVHVQVVQHDTPIMLRAAARLVGRSIASPEPRLFGGFFDYQQYRTSRAPGPTLVVDFSSAGGGLVVRDYPDGVEPTTNPEWPGYPVYVEERPDTTGLPKAEAKQMVRDWRTRREEQIRSKEDIDRLMNGPCVAAPKKAKAK